MISATTFYKHFGGRITGNMKADKIAYDYGDLSKLDEQQKKEEIQKQKTGLERKLAKIRAGVDDFFDYLKYMTFFLLPVYALVFKVLNRRTKAFYVDHLVYTIHLQSFMYCLVGAALLLPFVFPSVLKFLLPALLFSLFVYISISLHFLYKQVWWKTFLKALLATVSLHLITVCTMIFYAAVDAIFFM
jgi:hypothetical protein